MCIRDRAYGIGFLAALFAPVPSGASSAVPALPPLSHEEAA